MKITPVIATWMVIGAVAAVPANAQQLGDSQVFAVVSAAPGGGTPPTQWVSDVTVHSLSDEQVVVGFQLFPEGQPNQLDQTFTGPLSATTLLGPRGTVTVTNVVEELFGIDSVKGILLVSASEAFFPDNPDDVRILATSRTYNVGSPDGTYGQTVSANIDLASPFEEPSLVTGARQDARYRSNLGIASLAFEDTITVRYRVLDGTGATVVEGARPVPPLSLGQWSFASLGVPETDGPLTVLLSQDPASVTPDLCDTVAQDQMPNAFLGYVSKVDGNPRGTGDAEFIPAVPSRTLDCP